MIHFELLLRNVWRLDQWLIFQPVDTQLFQHHWLKPAHPSLNWICNIVKNQLGVLVWDYFWVPYSAPLISVFILPPIPTILLTVYKQSENWVGWFLSILLFQFSWLMALLLFSFSVYLNLKNSLLHFNVVLGREVINGIVIAFHNDPPTLFFFILVILLTHLHWDFQFFGWNHMEI